MKITVKIPHNLNDTTALKSKISEGLNRVVKAIEADAKRNAPVRTGTLRRSITSEVNGLVGKVGTTLVYAKFPEYGTRYKTGVHYLENAYQSNQGFIKSTIVAAVEDYANSL